MSTRIKKSSEYGISNAEQSKVKISQNQNGRWEIKALKIFEKIKSVDGKNKKEAHQN